MDTNTAQAHVIMICPNLRCRKVLQVAGQYRGQYVKCSYCQTAFAVPANRPAQPPPTNAPGADKE